MEIKKGISQMAEYPNVEINYVVPMDGQMYYVLRDGELANGAIIATLDPKRAIDSSVVSNSIGVFSEDGSVLIDFDKKDIRKVDDNYLLVVNSIPKTQEVINALKNENDEINKTMVKDNSTTIIDKMMIEMGITGEVLFSDAYSEANIYKISGVNEEIGPNSSFIGKNDQNFYFHTNDVASQTVLVSLKEEVTNQIEVPTELTSITGIGTLGDYMTPPVVAEDVVNQDTKLDINQSILGDFKPLDDEVNEVTPVEQDNMEEANNVVIPTEEDIPSEIEDIPSKIEDIPNSDNDAVLDNVIRVMKKMIEETSKLNNRISELEKEIDEKNMVISREESKKNTLNDLLDEANEILDNID